MRVVVTGVTGNVGSALVQALAEDDSVDEIIGVSRRGGAGWRPPKTTFRSADVATDDLAPVMAGADAVVNLAWTFHPTHDPLVTWRNNVIGSMRVFEAAARAGAGVLVHASSVGAYSERDDGPDRPVDESWPTHALPTAAYGREKSYLERVLDRIEADHPEMRVVRMRPAFIFRVETASAQRR